MPSTDDQIFGAPRDPKVFILIKPSKITRAQEPTIKIEVFVFLCLRIGISSPDTRTRHTNFANFIRFAFYKLTTLSFYDFNL